MKRRKCYIWVGELHAREDGHGLGHVDVAFHFWFFIFLLYKLTSLC